MEDSYVRYFMEYYFKMLISLYTSLFLTLVMIKALMEMRNLTAEVIAAQKNFYYENMCEII